MVKVEKDQYFPADLLLLSSTNDDGIAYVETMNLDGETNLKIKKALEQTKGLTQHNISTFKVPSSCLICHIYPFCMHAGGQAAGGRERGDWLHMRWILGADPPHRKAG